MVRTYYEIILKDSPGEEVWRFGMSSELAKTILRGSPSNSESDSPTAVCASKLFENCTNAYFGTPGVALHEWRLGRAQRDVLRCKKTSRIRV